VPQSAFVACFVWQKNVGQAGGTPGLDLNVEAAWAKGYTGKNVTTVIMDDGIDYLHPDLYFNYVSCHALASDIHEHAFRRRVRVPNAQTGGVTTIVASLWSHAQWHR